MTNFCPFSGRAASSVRLLPPLIVVTIFLACLEPRPAFSREPLPAARNAANSSALRWRVLSFRPLRLFYYTDDAPSFQSLKKHWRKISLLAPQCYWIQPSGIVSGAVAPRIYKLAQRHHIPLMPLVFNRGFDRATVTQLLRNPEARTRLVAGLTSLVDQKHLVGIQIDLENIAPEDRANFSALVREAALKFHSDGKLLSVALPPKSIVVPAAGPQTGTGNWAAAFDYGEIARDADFVTIMAYDQHGRGDPPGPVAGYGWVRRVLDYATRRIPAQRILLGVPLYGREWIESGAVTSAHTLTLRDARALIRRKRVPVRWDADRRSPWFTYRQGSIRYQAWFENAQSLKSKLALVSQYKLRGFAAWRLGSEDSSVWKLPLLSGAARRQIRRGRRTSVIQ